MEDVPGLGKTTLARALSRSIDGTARRIQFTPDLLPSDVTGVTIFHQGSNEFEFHPGPIFANIVIADEINRASPKTQSALLEVMEEQRVTVDGVPKAVPRPFMVVATQNPIEMDGTYRLPEAQLDRFLMRLEVGYPDEESEVAIIRDDRGATNAKADSLTPVTDVRTIAGHVDRINGIHIAPLLEHYVVRLVSATRRSPDLQLGASPRGSLAMVRAARAAAFVAGRDFVIPEDIQDLAEPVLAHRLILTPDAELRGVKTTEALRRVVESVPVPAATNTADR